MNNALRLFPLLAFFLLAGCNRHPVPEFEGPVEFVNYRDENMNKRMIYSYPQPEDYHEQNFVERWNADPYVRLFANYVEITYTKPDSERTTHVIPREGLFLLKWRKGPPGTPTATPKK